MTIQVPYSLDDLDPDNGNYDVFVHLDDGRVYNITVATPSNIYWCMDNEGLDYFFGCPPLLVKRLTPENVERAIKALVEDERFLALYGVLQRGGGPDESGA
jgi:hypothetical protein